jgi:hypothetical protein
MEAFALAKVWKPVSNLLIDVKANQYLLISVVVTNFSSMISSFARKKVQLGRKFVDDVRSGGNPINEI